jgi:hypothetical protein
VEVGVPFFTATFPIFGFTPAVVGVVLAVASWGITAGPGFGFRLFFAVDEGAGVAVGTGVGVGRGPKIRFRNVRESAAFSVFGFSAFSVFSAAGAMIRGGTDWPEGALLSWA